MRSRVINVLVAQCRRSDVNQSGQASAATVKPRKRKAETLNALRTVMNSRDASSRHIDCRVGLTLLIGLMGLGATLPAVATTTVTQITYDAGDHVASFTDPRGLVTTYSYDGLDQLWQQASPDTGTTRFDYDIYGRRTKMTRTDNVQTTYGYDGLNRTISISADGQAQSFTYDACSNGVGRLCSMGDSTGATSYSYSPEGWLTHRGFSVSGTTYSLSYRYNNQGQVASVVYPDGNEAIYSYTRGLVSGITLNLGGTTLTGASAIAYQPATAGVSHWTSSNGLINNVSYDNDGRLTGISAGSVQSLGFSYDKADRIVGIVNGIDSSMSQNFGYDDESRLVSVYSGADNERFQYDASGNRLSQSANGSSLTYTVSTTSNRLSALSGAVTASYGYSPQGNTKTVNGVNQYQYNPFNRLTSAAGLNAYINAEGWRLRKTGSLGTSYFAPHPDGSLASEYSNGAWVDYIRLDGRLIGRIAAGKVYAIHDDQVGRPEAITDANGAVVWRARNLAFTRTVTENSIGGLNIGFPGQYYDEETGLWNNGFRDYEAELGRYLESDPISLAGGLNVYAYVGNNPVNAVDPTGLAPEGRNYRILCFVYFLACNQNPNILNQPPPEPPPGYSAPTENPGDIFKIKGLKKPSIPKAPPEQCPATGDPNPNPLSSPSNQPEPTIIPTPTVVPAVPVSVPWFILLPPQLLWRLNNNANPTDPGVA